MSTVKPIPKGAHTVIANLTLNGCAKALEFYKRALGAELIMSMPAPDGTSVWHAEMRIGTSVVYANDAMPGMGAPAPSPESPAPVGFWVWSVDCDAAFKRAVEAGATVKMPPMDMFWGDRTATVLDPFGYIWNFATHVKDMTEAEMHAAGEAFAKQMASQP